MQQLTTALASHLAQEVTTLATCWSIMRKDGVALYFTDHDENLTIDGQVYEASDSMNPSAVSSQSGLTVDNLELQGILSVEAITQEDLLSGRYDHAQISVFMVNYEAPSTGKLKLKTGWLGEVTVQGGQFTAEMRGLSAQLQQTIGEVYTKSCRATLADARCGVNLSAYSFSGTVTGIEANFAFTDASKTQSNGYFSGGLLRFTSGANQGLSMEVRDFTNRRFGLFLPLPNLIALGDTYTVSAGCDKEFTTCIGKFNNALNFRGEPHVPGIDKLLETSGTRSG